MGNIFVTGSADGLGQLAARHWSVKGHQVVLRATPNGHAMHNRAWPAAARHRGRSVDVDDIRRVAEAANAWGRFDAVIHNAGVYPGFGARGVHRQYPVALSPHLPDAPTPTV